MVLTTHFSRLCAPETSSLIDQGEQVERLIAALPQPVTQIVLKLAGATLPIARAFADAYPGAHVTVLATTAVPKRRRDLGDRVTFVSAKVLAKQVAALVRIPQPQVFVDACGTPGPGQLRTFRHLAYTVALGGLLVIADASHEVIDDVERTRRIQSDEDKVDGVRKVDRELARSFADIAIHDRTLWATKVGHHLVKLRHEESEDVLTARYGERWGRTLERRPARMFTSDAVLTAHGSGPFTSGRLTYAIPEMRLTEYDDARVLCRQLARHGDHVIAESFRHAHQPKLRHRQLEYGTQTFGRVRPGAAPISTRRLPGAWFFFDSEFPGHFGHITTEVLSRVWGWRAAQRLYPGIRPLVSVRDQPARIASVQCDVFTALGIPLETTEIVVPGQEVLPETLITATPGLENPFYVAPEIALTWQELGANLHGSAARGGERIFVSRRPGGQRDCHNAAEVEQYFAGRGFTVLYPEDLPYRDQAAVFANARVIAGFAGSGMFNAMFAPRARLILISGTSYTAANELLIAAANGNEVHYLWGDSELAMPQDHFWHNAYVSGFTFDLRRHRRALRRLTR